MSNTPSAPESVISAPAEELRSRVQPLVELIEATNGLDQQQAQTIVNYAIATYGLPFLEKFPILAISGPAGTGKTTLLEVLRLISYKAPKELIVGNASKAVLRDILANQITALIDEADEIYEDLLTIRYSRQTANMKVKRAGQEGGWVNKGVELFGATALHRRKPFKDSAVLSRSIIVRTKKAKVDIFLADDFSEFAEVLDGIAQLVEWKHVPQLGGNRIADTWAPLVAVDDLLGGDWKAYADEQMKAAQANLDSGRETEPSQAAFKSFLALAFEDEGNLLERVLLGSIANNLTDEEGMSSYQVGIILSDLGFTKANRGGRAYIYTGGQEKLAAVALDLGIEDELFYDDKQFEA